MENILKALYAVEDSFELYNFLGVDLCDSDAVDDSVATTFAKGKDLAAKAFIRQIELLKEIKSLCTTQRTLVETTNALPYGWMAAKHMEAFVFAVFMPLTIVSGCRIKGKICTSVWQTQL